MGYQSFSRLPYISTYAEASAKLNSTKPIKKNSVSVDGVTVFPLGDRRYARMFGIRMADDMQSLPISRWYKRTPNGRDGDIELLLYQAPVITFHKDETVTLCAGAYRWGVSTCKFIEEVLGRYVRSARTDRGRLVLEMYHGPNIVVKKDEHVTLSPVSDPAVNGGKRYLTVLGMKGLSVVRMDRKKANEVRKRYGEFFRYFKGMLALRTDTTEQRVYMYSLRTYMPKIERFINVSAEEMQTVVPVVEEVLHDGRTVRRYVTHGNPHIKPPKIQKANKYNEVLAKWEMVETREHYTDYLASSIIFMDLIQPLKEGEDYENYRRAFLYLVFYANSASSFTSTSIDFRVEVDAVRRTLDRIMFMYHSDEVFYYDTAEPGQVPSARYEAWVTRERD